MKLLSSFDTKLRSIEVAKYKRHYGADKILVVSRSILFLFIYVITPILGMVLVISVILLLSYEIQGMSGVLYLGGGLSGLVLFLMGFPIIKRYIDYKMDYCIITPKEILQYNQSGILQRNITSMNTAKVTSIYARRKDPLCSLFNNGDIVMLCERDELHSGEVLLNHVYKPEQTRNRIAKIIQSFRQY